MPAGWLGGMSTVRPSESVGGVTPSAAGTIRRGGSSDFVQVEDADHEDEQAAAIRLAPK